MSQEANLIESVTFSVNGQTDTKDHPDRKKLRAAAKEVLGKTGNPTDLDRWRLTLDDTELDFDATFAEAGVDDGDTLVLSARDPGHKA